MFTDDGGKLMNAINNWMKPIQKLQRFMKSPAHPTLESPSSIKMLYDDDFQSLSIFAVNLPENMSSAQKYIKNNLCILHRATINQKSVEINQILLNMELLAFSFSWFAKVCFLFLLYDIPTKTRF